MHWSDVDGSCEGVLYVFGVLIGKLYVWPNFRREFEISCLSEIEAHSSLSCSLIDDTHDIWRASLFNGACSFLDLGCTFWHNFWFRVICIARCQLWRENARCSYIFAFWFTSRPTVARVHGEYLRRSTAAAYITSWSFGNHQYRWYPLVAPWSSTADVVLLRSSIGIARSHCWRFYALAVTSWSDMSHCQLWRIVFWLLDWWRRAAIRLLGLSLSLIAILLWWCNSWRFLGVVKCTWRVICWRLICFWSRTAELWRCDRFLIEVHWCEVTSEGIRKNVWVKLLREWFCVAAR